MDITHIAEQHLTASDTSLAAVVEALAEKDPASPIRIRLPLMLYDGDKYVAWKSEVWKIDVKDRAEAIEFKVALEIFFATVGRCGMPRTVAALLAEQEQPND